jgi:RNA polymerase sigma factor (sigma-70 family)
VSALLVREATYEDHRDYVLSVLRRRCRWLDSDEREAVFHDAYALMLEKERDGRLDAAAMHPRQLRAYFAQTAINKALDEGKRAERRLAEPIGERALAAPDPAVAPDDLAAASMDSARMREIVGELPERAQTIVKLRFYFDRTPEEIQGYLRISERAYRRELERALRKIAEVYRLVRDDAYCDSRRSLILAYVAGIAGPSRMDRARAHLATCPGCARWAAELRTAAEKAAAVLPLPPLALDQGPLSRLVESAGATVADLTGGAKAHATALATRVDAATPQYASAARPGTVAAAIAGCVAIGTGATYCVTEGVPTPVTSLVQAQQPKERPKPPKRKQAKASQEVSPTVPATPIVTAPAPPPQTETQPAPQPAPAPAPAPAPPPVDQEFGLEGAAQPSASPAPAPAPSPAPAPAPAPSGPPGEFDP